MPFENYLKLSSITYNIYIYFIKMQTNNHACIKHTNKYIFNIYSLNLFQIENVTFCFEYE